MDAYHFWQLIFSLLFLAGGVSIIVRVYKNRKENKSRSIGQKVLSTLAVLLGIILIAFGGIGNIIRIMSEVSDPAQNTTSNSTAETSTYTQQDVIQNCASQLLDRSEPDSGITLADATKVCTCTTNAYIQQYGSMEKGLELVRSGDPQATSFKDQTDQSCLAEAGLVMN